MSYRPHSKRGLTARRSWRRRPRIAGTQLPRVGGPRRPDVFALLTLSTVHVDTVYVSGYGSLRDRLLAVTGELLDAEGVEGVSLREIARRAGVSHGAPMRHFPSLASLLAHVSAEGFRRLGNVVAADAASSGPSALDRLAGAGRAYCQFGLSHPGLLTLMFRWDLVDLSEPQLATASHEAFDRFTDLVVAAQAEGWQPGREPRRLAGALWSAVHGLVSLWLPGALQRPTGATEIEEILGPLLAIILNPEEAEGATHDVLDSGL